MFCEKHFWISKGIETIDESRLMRSEDLGKGVGGVIF